MASILLQLAFSFLRVNAIHPIRFPALPLTTPIEATEGATPSPLTLAALTFKTCWCKLPPLFDMVFAIGPPKEAKEAVMVG